MLQHRHTRTHTHGTKPTTRTQSTRVFDAKRSRSSPPKRYPLLRRSVQGRHSPAEREKPPTDSVPTTLQLRRERAHVGHHTGGAAAVAAATQRTRAATESGARRTNGTQEDCIISFFFFITFCLCRVRSEESVSCALTSTDGATDCPCRVVAVEKLGTLAVYCHNSGSSYCTYLVLGRRAAFSSERPGGNTCAKNSAEIVRIGLDFCSAEILNML